MGNLKYISTHHRVELVRAYAKLQGITDYENTMEDKEFNKLESFLFEDPVNRRLIDKGIERADKEVDLERYSQYSLPWYEDVVRDIPSQLAVRGKLTENAIAELKVTLSESQVTYLAAMILLAVRGGEIKDGDIERAGRAARSIYARLVDSE